MGWFLFVTLLTTPFVLITGQTPTLEIVQGTNKIDLGSELKLNCSVENGTSYTWFKDSELIPNATEEIFSRTVTKQDGGNYTCRSGNDTSNIQIITVYYIDQNSTISVNSSKVLVGESVEFTCNITTNIPPNIITIIFMKDDSILQSSSNRTYVIHSVRKNDTGLYKCNVTYNNITKTTSSIQMTVRVIPTVSLRINPIKEFGSQNITCNASDVGSITQYVWKYNNIVVNETSPILQLYNVSRALNNASYSCYALVDNHTSNTAEATLNLYWMEVPVVGVPKHIYQENDTIILTCNVDANPSNVEYVWYKNGARLPGIALKKFEIEYATRNETGNYTCGTNSSEFNAIKMSLPINVTVVYMGDATIKAINNTQTPVNSSGILVLTCEVLDYSDQLSLEYVWSKNGVIKESKEGVMTLANVSKGDAGDYKCEVNGTYGNITITKSTTISVTVYYKAIGLSVDTNKKEIELSSKLTIRCSAQDYGEPRAVMSWKRNGTMQSSSVNGTDVELSITNATFLDTGVYTCTASNIAGEISLRYEIIVIGPPTSPTDLKATSKTSTSIKIQWQAPIFNGNKIVTGYKIRYKAQENTMDYTTNETNLLSFDINGLEAFLYYEIKVQAINSQGSSSDTTIIERTGEAVPSKPQRFGQLLPLLSKKINLTWNTPNPANGIISSYNICYTQLTSDRVSVTPPLSESCKDVGNVTEYSLTNLEKYSSYKISVCATNGVGCGDKAELIDIYTRQEEPMTVSDLNVSVDAYNASVTWNRPRNIYGVFQAYSISYQNQPSSPPITRNVTDFTITSINITGLAPNNNYIIEIVVFNDIFKSNVVSGIYKTLGVAPPQISNLIVPLKDQVEKTRFVIKLKPFDQTNGIVQKYQVIVFELSSGNLPSKKPWEYTESEIEGNIRGELTSVTEGQEFVIGGGGQSRRKRRSGLNFTGATLLLCEDTNIPLTRVRTRGLRNGKEVSNAELKENTYYGVFVRGFVRPGVYGYTEWYAVVKTDASVSNTGLIVGLVVAIAIIIILLILIVVYYRKRTRKNGSEIDLVESSNKKKSFISFLPGSDPRVPISAYDRFEDHVNRLKSNSNFGFSQEYSMISRELDYPYSQSRLQENNIKNRYHNVPAYDETRVKLTHIDNDPHSDYINANYVEGFDNEHEYIATQGPLPETVFDFWRMTWESESTTIVMLTRLEEKGRVKCAQYWPDSGSLSLKDIVITATEVHDFPDHVVRTFHLTRTGQAIERIVKQFHFTSWPDFGVPDDPSALLGFLRKVNNWKGLSAGPVIVHCSAGVGRTGTYITIDTQIKNIRKNKEISIFKNVTQIREQRCLMVQTEDQYIFIHYALLDYLEAGDTEVDANDLRDYIKKQSQVDMRTGLTGIMDEFIRLAKTDKKDKYTDANKSVNQAKNRYKNVYPYDFSRVRLSQRPGVDGSDYINANYIDSYGCKDMFIATQAPLENTIGDFWRMIWEQNCGTIVMLSKEIEGTQLKVHAYWPQKTSSKIEHFIIEMSSVTTYGDHIVRSLKLTNTETSSSREVKHFQYTTWPDTGSPDSGVGIIELIGQVQKWNSSINNKIITVHCSAGVGRTGVFMALTNLIERVKTESVVDVYLTVKKMRQQRTAMVQTRDQYEFIFRALQEYLDSFDLYANFR